MRLGLNEWLSLNWSMAILLVWPKRLGNINISVQPFLLHFRERVITHNKDLKIEPMLAEAYIII